jgi:hypothetical protein
MTVTLEGEVTLGDLRSIVREYADYVFNPSLTIFVPFESWMNITKDTEVQNTLAWMASDDLTSGQIRLWGANIQGYFPELTEAEDN